MTIAHKYLKLVQANMDCGVPDLIVDIRDNVPCSFGMWYYMDSPIREEVAEAMVASHLIGKLPVNTALLSYGDGRYGVVLLSWETKERNEEIQFWVSDKLSVIDALLTFYIEMDASKTVPNKGASQ